MLIQSHYKFILGFRHLIKKLTNGINTINLTQYQYFYLITVFFYFYPPGYPEVMALFFNI